jgi:hypothetical protein
MDPDALLAQLTQQQEQSNRLQEQKLQQLMHEFAVKMERLVANCGPRQGTQMELDQQTLVEPEGGEWSVENAWEDVVPAPERAPTGAATALVSRLGFPPPLDTIRTFIKEITPYLGVPKTPPARKEPQDRALQGLQHKIEIVMHLLVETAETSGITDGPLVACAAVARSVWEDTNEIRRRNMARGQAFKLDTREDATTIRLLSDAEEKAIRPTFNSNAHRGKGIGRKGFASSSRTDYHGSPFQRWTSSDGKGYENGWKGGGGHRKGSTAGSSKGSGGRGRGRSK